MSVAAIAHQPPGVELERLRWWDLEEVLAIESDAFGADAWTPAQFWSELARVPESRWYVTARESGMHELLGYGGIFVVAPEADVQTIAVARAAQGRGVGALLVDALIAAAGERGAAVMHLEVRADNGPARALYARAGFVDSGRRRDYYGRGQDAVLMTLRMADRQADATADRPVGRQGDSLADPATVQSADPATEPVGDRREAADA